MKFTPRPIKSELVKYAGVTLSLSLLLSIVIHGQQVEIQGKAKVSIMDTVNNAQLLVVKQSDGTLATRQLTSLPLPPPDTTRTLVSDMQLVKLLCDCPSIPPGMVNALLDNGYALSDLLDFDVAIPDLTASGITLAQLIAAGAPSSDLFTAGFTVQELLLAGLTPLQVYNGGVPLLEIYGEEYAGGLIFYIDYQDNIPGAEGLVAAPVDQPSVHEWGCWGTALGINDTQIGTGANNTLMIDTSCTVPGIAADVCENLSFNGYNDWFLPSQDELVQMYLNLHSLGHGSFSLDAYWSSTESISIPTTDAMYLNFNNGSVSATWKDSYFKVRPARAY